MSAPKCVLCKEPTTLCQCSNEVRAFGDAHIVTHDGERALIDGETLRVLIERAQAWGREHSQQGYVSSGSELMHADNTVTVRDAIIEECAQAADQFNDPERVSNIVAAIRALKRRGISGG